MIGSILRSKGMKVTPQRIAILECLNKKTHPTVEEIYHSVLSVHPAVSLATVYKNINSMYEEGLISQVNTGKMMRYDVVGVAHIHSVCKKCHQVKDIFLDDEKREDLFKRLEMSTKEKVETCEITLFSICPSCEG